MDTTIFIPTFSPGTTIDIRQDRFDVTENPIVSQRTHTDDRVAVVIYATLFPPFGHPGTIGFHQFSFEGCGLIASADIREYEKTIAR